MLTSDGPELRTGVGASLERWNGEAWVPEGQLAMCLDHWHCTAEVEAPDAALGINDIGIGASPGRPGPAERFSVQGLDTGWYRLSQGPEGDAATAVFEVADGAPTPAPLPPIDAVAISVTPVLVPSASGTVTITPLVPYSSTGFLTRDDILTAVRGLSETAIVQRWQDDAWTDVGSVDLRPSDPDPVDISLRVDLPVLPEGAYRLWSTGTSDAAGSFWVVDAATLPE